MKKLIVINLLVISARCFATDIPLGSIPLGTPVSTNYVLGVNTNGQARLFSIASIVENVDGSYTNVIQAGAQCGNIDDTALVQNLVNTLSGTGTGILFPNSTQYTLGTIYLTNGTKIKGFQSVINAKSSMSNSAVFEVGYNTNIYIEGLNLKGGAYVGPAGGGNGGITNRIGIRGYAYSGKYTGNTIEGFDYGIYLVGDKTTTTSHQSKYASVYGNNISSNYTGIITYSPDSSHVVEYITLDNNVFCNYRGYTINSGNITIRGQVDNNGIGLHEDGLVANNPGHTLVSAMFNHNLQAFGATNILSGMVISGCQVRASANNIALFENCAGIQFINNGVDTGNIWFTPGASPTAGRRNFVKGNVCQGYGGGNGTFTVIDADNTVECSDNQSFNDTTGQSVIFYKTNIPAVGLNQELTHTNAWSLVDSNATATFYFIKNNGSGAAAVYPINKLDALTVSTNSTLPVTPGSIAAWINVTNQSGKVGKIPVYY